MDESEIEKLAATVRELDASGASDEDVASWLKPLTASLGESGSVLAVARGVSKKDAYAALHATPSWQGSTTRHRLRLADGTSFGELHSPNGRRFAVGDRVNLPNSPEPPHTSEPGRGSVWRVLAVEPLDDPAFIARVTVEAVKRLA